MAGAYSKIPTDTFQHISSDAMMVMTTFSPESANGTVTKSNILGSTTGGVSFSAVNEYIDYGEDVDNCPKNTKELKRFNNVTVTCSGNFVAMTDAIAKRLMALADVSSVVVSNTDTGIKKVTPRTTFASGDFADLWLVGNYSDVNTGTGAGFIAIHLMNAFSTGGFQIQSTDKAKMQFSFEFTAHFSLDNEDTVPYEIYIKPGVAPVTGTGT